MPNGMAVYYDRKSRGLCVKCGETAEANKSLCPYHLEQARRLQNAVLDRRRSNGLCPLCGGELTNNRKTCNSCLEKRLSKSRDEVRIPWTNRKELGLCVACGKLNSVGTRYCPKCKEKYKKTQDMSRVQRVASGLCGICGKRLSVRGKRRCIICIHKRKKWYSTSKFRIKSISSHKTLRNKIIIHYGGECVCCGETEKTFLAIDHINGHGNKHRKQIRKSSGRAYHQWIVDQNFPDYLQILCYNCNMSKYLNGGVCAHQSGIDCV